MKKYIRKICIITALLFLFLNESFSQTDSIFWFVAPEINNFHSNSGLPDSKGEPTYFRFSNTEDYEVTVTITQPNNGSFSPISVDIPAKETRSVQFRFVFDDITTFDVNSIENLIEPSSPLLPSYNHGRKGLRIFATGKINGYYLP
jgi:hypothetical protein